MTSKIHINGDKGSPGPIGPGGAAGSVGPIGPIGATGPSGDVPGTISSFAVIQDVLKIDNGGFYYTNSTGYLHCFGSLVGTWAAGAKKSIGTIPAIEAFPSSIRPIGDVRGIALFWEGAQASTFGMQVTIEPKDSLYYDVMLTSANDVTAQTKIIVSLHWPRNLN